MTKISPGSSLNSSDYTPDPNIGKSYTTKEAYDRYHHDPSDEAKKFKDTLSASKEELINKYKNIIQTSTKAAAIKTAAQKLLEILPKDDLNPLYVYLKVLANNDGNADQKLADSHKKSS